MAGRRGGAAQGGRRRSKKRLVVACDGPDAPACAEAEPLPDRYATLPLYHLLRACERFGLPPWGLDEPACPEAVRLAAIEFDRVRQAEEFALVEMIVKALA